MIEFVKKHWGIVTFVIIILLFPYDVIDGREVWIFRIDLAKYNDFGGFIGGVLSIVAVILIYQTYQTQKEELRETKEQIEKSAIAAEKQAKAMNELAQINKLTLQFQKHNRRLQIMPSLRVFDHDPITFDRVKVLLEVQDNQLRLIDVLKKTDQELISLKILNVDKDIIKLPKTQIHFYVNHAPGEQFDLVVQYLDIDRNLYQQTIKMYHDKNSFHSLPPELLQPNDAT